MIIKDAIEKVQLEDLIMKTHASRQQRSFFKKPTHATITFKNENINLWNILY